MSPLGSSKVVTALQSIPGQSFATTTKENLTAEQPARPPRRPRIRIENVQDANVANHPLKIVWAGWDVTQEDLRYPEFWRPYSEAFKVMVFDRFEVRAHDRSWRVECTAIAVSQDGVTMNFDKVTQFKAPAEPPIDDGNFTIRCEGGMMPWVIYRNRDNSKLSEHPTKAEALRELKRLYARPVQ